MWEVSPGLFGWDVETMGWSVYQPLRFPGQLYDEDTEARALVCGDWYCVATLARPGVTDNRYRVYDSFTGTYLQVDPMVDETWEPYTYVGQDPVGSVDPTGL